MPLARPEDRGRRVREGDAGLASDPGPGGTDALPDPPGSSPARPVPLLGDAVEAELARLKLAGKVRREQLKAMRHVGSLFGDVLARGFLAAYLLHLCEERPRHGNDILKEIEARTDGLWTPSSGGVYTLLRKLEKRQLLEGAWESGATRERRVYRITAEGRQALDEFRTLAPPRVAAALRVLQLVGADLLSGRDLPG
ncbi:MAG TPA: PadR family transcriptional regulator [Acidimicrobiales bacterium]|nr:PadR family transcriptional regulator [Acidimicrobiales bacterium]